MVYEKCREILLKECELVQEASVLHEKVRQAIFNHEWEGFEENSKALNKIENDLASIDNERVRIFSAFEALLKNSTGSFYANGAGNSFYAMICYLPEDQREELASIYRSLKMETMKLRISNETLTTYLSGVKSTVKEFFDLAFPERAGSVYTPQGTHSLHDMRSIVLNQSF